MGGTASLEISTLGGLSIRLADEPLTALKTRKEEALLVYLACNPREHPREKLAEFFWEERTQALAMTNLRGALYSLRKHLEPYVIITRDSVALNPEADIRLDIAKMEKKLDAAQIEEAVALYRGDFLEGFYIRGARGFDDWVTIERERLRQLVLDALGDLVVGHLDAGTYKDGVRHARRLLNIDPLLEEGHQQLMRLLAYSGQRGPALAQYGAWRQILKEEFGMEPIEETKALYQLIQAGELEVPALRPERPPSVRAVRMIRSYELHERIGAGGFGEVYRAYQPSVGREVAIKVILPQFANNPDFIRRFETEAQLVARLEHLHIVPLYDYWREPDGAYLVMRWLRGGNLHQSLQRHPWTPRAAARLLDQAAGALAVAHRQGVVHRDIKPQNILLDEEDNAYLSDFGIAKELMRPSHVTQTGDIVGSPAYISPEQAQSAPLTAQSDLYSLGVVMYQVLTGEHPFAEVTPAVQLVKHLTEPLPPLRERRPELPEALEAVIQQVTAKDPAARYPDALAFAAAFRGAISPTEVDIALAPDREALELVNPYKGLRPFEEADAADFFGREALTEQLLTRLREDGEWFRFLAVVGPSGSGKSSVVKAGLLPAIRSGALPGSENWFIVEILPGAHPLDELEIGLLRVAIDKPPGLMEQLRRDERGLLRAVRLVLPTADSELLLVIDQFEELFTRAVDRAESEHLLRSLHAAVSDPRSKVRVIITLRADFYDRPLMHPDLGQLMRQRTEVVLPLTADELAAAIREPAQRAGAELEPGLMTAIVSDVSEQPGALPMLQYALTELFECRDGRVLTGEAFQAIGGIAGALARRAEEVHAALDESEQVATRQLFLRLVTLGEGVEDTRRRVLRSELVALQTSESAETPQALDKVIDEFGRHRLLTFDRDPATREPTVELAHEALLREWPRLREWLDESRADIRLQRLLASASAEWLGAERDPGFLLRGARLDRFAGWAEDMGVALTRTERDYLDASLAARRARKVEEGVRQRRELEMAQKLAEMERARAEEEVRTAERLRRWAVVLAGALFVAGVLATVALWLSRQATQERETAQAEADSRATAEAVALEQREEARRLAGIGLASQVELHLTGPNSERAVPLALEALENYPYTWQMERALGLAVLGSRLRLILQHEQAVGSAYWSPDGTRILTASDDGTAKVWDANTGEALLTLSGHEDAVVKAAVWSSSGEQILTVGWDGTAWVWDAATGEELLPILGVHWPIIWGATWSPAGDRILAYGDDGGGIAKVWDVSAALNTGAGTGKQLFILRGHTGPVWHAAWSPDGARIVTGGDDGTVKVWDANSGVEIVTFSKHKAYISEVAWSPDSSRVATASRDGTAKVWDAASGEELLTLAGHTAKVTRVAWSPDGSRVATASDDGTAKVWDPTTGEELATLSGHEMYLIAIEWSPDGSRVVTGSGDRTAKVWDANTGVEIVTLFGHTSEIHRVAWSPAGDRVLTASRDGTARIWDLSPALLTVPGPEGILSMRVAWSPQGDRVARTFDDGTTKVWDLSSVEGPGTITAQELFVLSGHKGWVTGVQWSSSGDRILTAGCEDGTAKVWDANTGEELLTLSDHHSMVCCAEWSPDGTRIVTTDRFDTTARVWDAETGERTLTFTGHEDLAAGCAWSPDGKTIATTGSGNRPARIWDATTGLVILDLYPEDFEILVEGVAWSPDGTRIATSAEDGVVRIWDATTGDELVTFAASSTHLHWPRTGERIITCGVDGAIVWDANAGVELLRYDVGGPTGAALSPDGKYIATAGLDGTLNVFPAWGTLDELMDHARECCVTRELTDEERQQFGLPPR